MNAAVVLEALNLIGLAFVCGKDVWTYEDRLIYEQAVKEVYNVQARYGSEAASASEVQQQARTG